MIIHSKFKYKRGISSPNKKHLALDSTEEVGEALPLFTGPTVTRTFTMPNQDQNVLTADASSGVSDTLRTTDGVQQTLYSFTLKDNAVTFIKAHVKAFRTDGATAAAYVRVAAFRRSGATVAQIGSTDTPHTFVDATSTSWGGVVITNSTTTLQVKVTGVTSQTIDWRGHFIVETSP